MPAIYPRAPESKPAPPPFDEEMCASRLIEIREADPKITQVRAAGKLIHVVGGTVADIYRVWDEIEAVRVSWKAISPADYSSATTFKTALKGNHLSADAWYDGLRAEKDVTTWSALKAACVAVSME